MQSMLCGTQHACNGWARKEGRNLMHLVMMPIHKSTNMTVLCITGASCGPDSDHAPAPHNMNCLAMHTGAALTLSRTPTCVQMDVMKASTAG